MRYLARLAAILPYFALASCLYIPALGGRKPSQEVLLALRPGETRIEDVQHSFGRPNALQDSRFFVYEMEKGKGTLLIGTGALSGKDYTRLLCEFDSGGYLVRYSIARASYVSMGPMKYRPVSDSVDSVGTPEISASREDDVVLRGSKPFGAVAFSPDGKMLVAVDEGGRLWLRTKRRRREGSHGSEGQPGLLGLYRAVSDHRPLWVEFRI